VTSSTLASSYLAKSRSRLKILPVLLEDENYSDVVREAQEIVELALKAMLRQVGIEPPHVHDVGALLRQHRDRFDKEVGSHVDELAAASAWLRKEREFSFYGDIDFIPTEQYTRHDAERAIGDARRAVEVAGLALASRTPGQNR
jgi:HEPN domain-containing protein